MIEPSHFDPAEAWAAVDRHRLEDYKPYIYRTRDYGKTWTRADAEGLAEPAYINSVKEDPGAARPAVRGVPNSASPCRSMTAITGSRCN